MCLRPIIIPRPDNKELKISVPCGKCAACKTNRREEWTTRLIEESKNHLDSCFVTLTYNDENLPLSEKGMSLHKRDVQLFLKKLRKALDVKIRYYCVGEYGERTFRPHYHLIIFGIGKESESVIEKAWKKGNIVVGDVNIKSIKYCAKYHLDKGNSVSGSEKPFTLMSRGGRNGRGLGYTYVEKMKEFHSRSIDNCYVPHNEFKRKMPRYYKEKLYSSEQREEIAFKNSERNDNYKKLMEFRKKYPDADFFGLQEKKKILYERNYKTKVSKNQKL